MGRVSGKVAFITGAARGQGRAHAIRLAEEGADIVALDVCSQLGSVEYPMATPDDLAETAKLVEERDRRVLTRQVDVRNLAGMKDVVEETVAEFGGIDIVVANAGIATLAPSWELTEEAVQEMVDVNLVGVWKTTTATIPAMIERGRGGSIILTSSIAGLHGFANLSHYVGAKHGVTGLMKALAIECAPYNIRVNSLHPGFANTPMVNNDVFKALFRPELENPTENDLSEVTRALNAMDVRWLEAIDLANAVLWLASDEARYVTGTSQVVDAGSTAPYKIPHAT
jgi:SDR family mycofactocin-dependent oxidoreductase